MSIHSSRVVRFDSSGRVQSVLSIIDANNHGVCVETHIHSPYRSILRMLDSIVSMRTFDTAREAIRFHRNIARDIHEHSL